jgi:hypothetical protein
MKHTIVRFANWSHKQASPWVRRPGIVLAIVALGLNTALWWAFLPTLMVAWPFLCAAKGLLMGLLDIPRSTVASFASDFTDWRHNIAGARRIWRSQKVEPVIMQAPRP